LQVHGVSPFDPDSSRYTSSTAVQINGNLYSVCPNGTVPWDRSGWLDYVDFELERFADFSVITTLQDLGGVVLSRVDSFQVTRPLRPAVGQRSYNFNAVLIPMLRTMGAPIQTFEGVSNALEFFDQLASNFRYMRTRSFLSALVWWIIMLSLFFACLILVIRVCHGATLSRNLVEAWYNSTSIDFFAIGSLGIIRVDDAPRNWIQVIFFVIGIGVIPITIVAVFHIFGFSIL
jgi:hypothetical protein